MEKKSLSFLLLCWIEMVLSARILLFCLPVLINNLSTGQMTFQSPNDRFILILTFSSSMYFIIGLASLMGHKLWTFFHALALGVVAVLTAGFIWAIQDASNTVEGYYFMPVAMSAIFFIFATNIRLKTKVAVSWKSVLVIDDDETLIKTIRPTLIAHGFSVLTAKTGEMGLHIAKNQRPDLIILDVILPGIKGREVCKKIKEDSELKHIPVVFLTAKFSQDDIQAEKEAGAVSHLNKPVNTNELLTTIKNVLKI